ncbi:MAG TPA: DUF3108 domain-containing protein [Candidatus Sulfopaludibacter sp.]|jgi:hypothetical protein|nr:DUF3108 domain-containing protein [Candidatus Sulfopaludibacter sp.]
MLFRLMALGLAVSPIVFAQSNALPAKETLYYNVEWRLITAGKAKIEWSAAPRSGWHVNLHLESAGLVSKLFRVEDDYAANLGPGVCAESSQFTSNEGSRQRETRITYDGANRKATYLERDRVKNAVLLQREIEIPPCVHDVLGGMFFMRTLNLEPGQSTTIPVTDGKKSVMAKVEAQAREDVKTPEGVFHTIRYEAYLFNDALYHRPAHLSLWFTDDRRHLPVQIRVRMQITIGTITLQLEKHE